LGTSRLGEAKESSGKFSFKRQILETLVYVNSEGRLALAGDCAKVGMILAGLPPS
jgi:hypothetical protein